MTPEYFKRELRPYEAEAYLDGVAKAERASWEQTRSVMYSNLAPWSKNLKATDILEFSWDKERVEAEAPTSEEIDNVREWAAHAAELLNKHGR